MEVLPIVNDVPLGTRACHLLPCRTILTVEETEKSEPNAMIKGTAPSGTPSPRSNFAMLMLTCAFGTPNMGPGIE
jgi:hypothetical protein